MSTGPLTLVVPCYNEARRLDVAAFRAWLRNGLAARLLLVDDGSTDSTVSVLEQVREGHEEVVSILKMPKNGGKAEAVRAGMLSAIDSGAAFAGFWDADLATPLVSVANLFDIFDTRPDIEMVFGSRVKLLGRHVERRPVRHYLGRIFATAVSNTLRLPIYDTQCGAKLFRVYDHTRSIFAEPFRSKWVFDVEIIARYLVLYGKDPRRLERVIYEYPLETWVDVAGSKVKPADFLVAFWDVLRIGRAYLR